MTAKERTLYFAAVCLMLVSLGILLLAFAQKAHAASTWIVNDACTSGGTFSVPFDQHVPPKWTSGTTFSTVGIAEIGFVTSLNAGTGHITGTNNFGTGNCNPPFAGSSGSLGGDLQTIMAGQADGTYYVLDFNYGGYLFFTMSGGNVTYVGTSPTPPNTTSITVINPTQGTTTPTTTFNIDLDYTIGSDLSTFSLDGSLPQQIGINLVLQNAANGQSTNLGTDFNISTTTGNFSYSTSTTAAQSDYTLIATLVGDYGFTPTPSGCEPIPPFVTCGGSQNVTTLVTALPAPTFSVANGAFPLLGFQVGSTTSRNGLATTTCDVIHVGGCFQNALTFLFFPSPDVLNQFSFLWSLIQNKPPFGYVSQTIVGLRGINASSTPAFSFGNIPLVSAIFTPFRTGLAGILWIGFFIAWYRGRLRHLDI